MFGYTFVAGVTLSGIWFGFSQSGRFPFVFLSCGTVQQEQYNARGGRAKRALRTSKDIHPPMIERAIVFGKKIRSTVLPTIRYGPRKGLHQWAFPQQRCFRSAP